jgi:hypothetical protein
MQDNTSNVEGEARRLVEEAEGVSQQEGVAAQESARVTNLGKAQRFQHTEESPLSADIGWKNLPPANLPSQGLFYPDGTEVAIRAASVAEIRHWSTIDENDALAIDDMLNFIMERCCRIRMGGRPANFKDLKEIDRFYIIFAVRDFTFKNGENRLYTTYPDDNGVEERVEVNKDSLSYFNPEEKLMRHYNAEKKCFVFQMKNGETLDLHFPSLGVMAFIKNYARAKSQRQQQFDRAFLKYAPFLIQDWKGFTEKEYEKMLQNSIDWSIQKISLLDKVTTMLAESINPQVRFFKKSGEETTIPLNFRGGVKSIFLIPDILDELV